MKNNDKKFSTPEIEVIKFDERDVIATSLDDIPDEKDKNRTKKIKLF